ncbi:hypothetical protein WOLCODRAFT_138811 [Wolfiporia cocos MD-104 SS10]|uniref:Fork-head domain-containing protein n=1 Tax=Wolfiporia cocos (strain MD-104) TaxID=742152 RepID=A0A2H3JPT5_WOLCO|nr:hypothetical protein WOLCODRAFT_138811 [Wolfiporia cocos MD-104 SS10]
MSKTRNVDESPDLTDKLLVSMGMTREDLRRHSEQMRQFLTVDVPQETQPEPEKPKKRRSRSSATRSRGKTRATSLADASTAVNTPTPPTTPVKTEPTETLLPPRRRDTMELVLEAKIRAKRERRDSSAHLRDVRRVEHSAASGPSRATTPQLACATPHHYRYYSERVVSEAPTPQPHLLGRAYSSAVPSTPQRHASLQLHGTADSRVETPVGRHIYSHLRTPDNATPASSPPRVVNMVSSPGPMRPGPPDDDDDPLPYTLPPGPYSSEKPEFAYAGLIGQAILSSPQHRLTLQDIYEWITTVYPYYKRGEQTWMNSIRHCLSTMAVFRKVPRGRAEGKSLWAVFDQDVECFEGGGFRKHLCADMVKIDEAKRNNKPPGRRRRNANDDTDERTSKKRKKNQDRGVDAPTGTPMPPVLPAPVMPPFFPPYHPNHHHQPYFQSYSQPLPAEVIFPPLPFSSNYHRLKAVSLAAEMEPSSSQDVENDEDARGRNRSSKLLMPSSDPPDLTPNCSSSSSPPLSSQASLPDARYSTSPPPSHYTSEFSEFVDTGDEDGSDWLREPSVEALAPSATLLYVTPPKTKKSKGKGKAGKRDAGKQKESDIQTLPQLDSPTLHSRPSAAKRRGDATPLLPSLDQFLAGPCTPPRRPCTPPRRPVPSGDLLLSPTRTPISHAGLHMSPSPSLAYYKSHLDPPPAAVFHPAAPLLSLPYSPKTPPPVSYPADVKTPSRKEGSASRFGSASRKDNSPFAITPLSSRYSFFSGFFGSPLRTPTRNYDPHDPKSLLDDEISRQNLQTSPGLFGRSRGLLYESPTTSSPGSWGRYY